MENNKDEKQCQREKALFSSNGIDLDFSEDKTAHAWQLLRSILLVAGPAK